MLVIPVTVMYTLLIGAVTILKVQDIVLAVLLTAEHKGLLISVLVFYTSFDQLNGNSKTTLLLLLS